MLLCNAISGTTAARKALPYAHSTPDAIEARSFAVIESEAREMHTFTGNAWFIARRLVHSAGDLSLLRELHLPDSAIDAGLVALRRSAEIFTDTEMARAGINSRRLEQLNVTASCILSRPGLDEEAKQRGVTRSRAGMESLGDRLDGAVVAVGNAPTALLALLDHLDAGGARPALIIAMAVGFVNAVEAKELLLSLPEIPCLAVRGRRGGSPLAAAAVNALTFMALEQPAGKNPRISLERQE
ncbi:MAG: precorrin-8X methylmutase [Desulfovibrio sp.]|jgi:precorrin-8X/cobalt-precorrin-8 methylmutase|nr:precorrin-8X methylmutase [Desulfovibrio sp.]